MKTKSILVAAFSICLISGSAFSQERQEVNKEVKNVKKEIRKEVRMEEENGVKTLTISTDENGVKTEEVYTGEEADLKLAEMEGSSTIEERIEVIVDHEVSDKNEVNDKKVTIKKTSNGMETIEVYEGEEADAKIKELESDGEMNVIIEKEVVVKEKKAKRESKKATKK